MPLFYTPLGIVLLLLATCSWQ